MFWWIAALAGVVLGIKLTAVAKRSTMLSARGWLTVWVAAVTSCVALEGAVFGPQGPQLPSRHPQVVEASVPPAPIAVPADDVSVAVPPGTAGTPGKTGAPGQTDAPGQTVTMQDYRRRAGDVAARQLRAAGFDVVVLSTVGAGEDGDKDDADKVVDQDPPPGTKVAPGSTVILTVATRTASARTASARPASARPPDVPRDPTRAPLDPTPAPTTGEPGGP